MLDEMQQKSDDRIEEILEASWKKPRPTPMQVATIVLLALLLIIGVYNTNTAARQAVSAARAAEKDSETNRRLLEGIENLVVNNRLNDERAREDLKQVFKETTTLVRQEGRERDEKLLSEIEDLINRLEGPAGSAGLSGIQGLKGETGADGEDGLPGGQGEQGETGETGQPGIPGQDSTVPGPVGPEGPIGPVGPEGPPAASTTTTTELPPFIPTDPPICGSPEDSGSGPCVLPPG